MLGAKVVTAAADEVETNLKHKVSQDRGELIDHR